MQGLFLAGKVKTDALILKSGLELSSSGQLSVPLSALESGTCLK